MIFDVLNLIATTVLAVAAVFIARNANSISQNANELADHANEISRQAVKLEADEQLIEWGQRVLCCASSLVALRTLKKGEIDNDEFIQKRRELRATLFALKEEGQLFFRGSGAVDGADIPPALKAVHELTELTNGKVFRLPSQDYDANSVRELRTEVRTVIGDIQSRVSDHWVR